LVQIHINSVSYKEDPIWFLGSPESSWSHPSEDVDNVIGKSAHVKDELQHKS